MNSMRWTTQYFVGQLSARWRRYWHCLRHFHQPENWYYNGFTIIRCGTCDCDFSNAVCPKCGVNLKGSQLQDCSCGRIIDGKMIQ